jgi:hypothetical protein
MLTQPRSTFPLVRNDACLTGANEDRRVYQWFLRRRSPASGIETVQGIWIDEEDVANLPSALVLPDAAGAQQTVRILEATGINGVWMLCWLDAAAHTVCRVDLVAALLACFGPEDATTHAAPFIPVFADEATGSRVSAGLQRLEACYPGLVPPPIDQNASGSLALPSASPHTHGSAS